MLNNKVCFTCAGTKKAAAHLHILTPLVEGDYKEVTCSKSDLAKESYGVGKR